MSWACVMLRYVNSTNTCVHNLKLLYGQGCGQIVLIEASCQNVSVLFSNFPINIFLWCKMNIMTIVRVLCRGKTWSFTLRIRKRFWNICGEGSSNQIRGNRKTGGWRKLQNEEIHNLYLSLKTIIIKYKGISWERTDNVKSKLVENVQTTSKVNLKRERKNLKGQTTWKTEAVTIKS
jgi:hypothetical protein